MSELSVSVEQMRRVLGGPPEAAVCWLREAARRGAPEAQTALGQHLLEGRGVAADANEAIFWFRTAARAAYPMAFNMLGRCYELGRGVSPDPLVAAYWYRLAAEAGLDWGMYNYATALMLGRGVSFDRATAFAWFQRAAGMGHAKSINIVGGFYEDGWEVDRNLQRALEHYARAAEGGDFRGQFNYGRLLGDSQRFDEARVWLQRCVIGATPAFMHKVLHYLGGSPHAPLREIGSQLAELGVGSAAAC